jgi:S1-C subfamily serine protease
MRALLVILLLLSGCYTYAPWQPEHNNQHWYHWLTSGTVQVRTNCGDDGVSSGSGVVVDRDSDGTAFVATAAHVVDPEGGTCTYWVDGNELFIAAYDEYYDQAILVGDVAGRTTEMAQPVFVGMRLIAVGFPVQPYTGLTSFQITHGTLTAFLGARYKTNADAYYGNSGGPAFDMHGDLVGLVVSMRVVSGVPIEWYLTPAWRTYELLEEARETVQ